MSKTAAPLPTLDQQQRYTIPETCAYLRTSRASVYKLIANDSLRVLKEGKRTFVPGSEIARRSQVPA